MLGRLTEREKEIARLLGNLYTDEAIGLVLNMKQSAVKTTIRRIIEKLNAGSRAQLVLNITEDTWQRNE